MREKWGRGRSSCTCLGQTSGAWTYMCAHSPCACSTRCWVLCLSFIFWPKTRHPVDASLISEPRNGKPRKPQHAAPLTGHPEKIKRTCGRQLGLSDPLPACFFPSTFPRLPGSSQIFCFLSLLLAIGFTSALAVNCHYSGWYLAIFYILLSFPFLPYPVFLLFLPSPVSSWTWAATRRQLPFCAGLKGASDERRGRWSHEQSHFKKDGDKMQRIHRTAKLWKSLSAKSLWKLNLRGKSSREGGAVGIRVTFSVLKKLEEFALLNINEIKLDIIRTGLFIRIMAHCRM